MYSGNGVVRAQALVKRQLEVPGVVQKGVVQKIAVVVEKRKNRGHYYSDGRPHGGHASELDFEG